jgi:hypothetical protein
MRDAMSDAKRLLFVGHSGAGKDTACLYLARATRLRFAGTTSDFLARHVAARLGVSVEQAYRTRHANRNAWHRVGNEIRRRDPGLLVRESLEHGELTAGARGIEEVRACRREGLVDLIVWIDNERVRPGPSLTVGPGDCDLVIANHGSLDEFHARLHGFAVKAGLPMRSEGEAPNRGPGTE